MRYFRKPNSPVRHLVKSTHLETMCGLNARLGAVWFPSDPNVDRCRWRPCTKCESIKQSGDGPR